MRCKKTKRIKNSKYGNQIHIGVIFHVSFGIEDWSGWLSALFLAIASRRSSSLLENLATIPAPIASPSTFTTVRNRSLDIFITKNK